MTYVFRSLYSDSSEQYFSKTSECFAGRYICTCVQKYPTHFLILITKKCGTCACTLLGYIPSRLSSIGLKNPGQVINLILKKEPVHYNPLQGVFLIQQTKGSCSFEVRMIRTVFNIALFNFPTVNS